MFLKKIFSSRKTRKFNSDKLKTDITLVMCPMWVDISPPFALSYLSQYMLSKGYESKVIDFNIYLFNNLPEHMKKYWNGDKMKYWENDDFIDLIFQKYSRQIQECVDKIVEHNAPVIGFSVFASNKKFTIKIAEKIKLQDKNKIIVYGGIGVSVKEWRREFPPNLVDIFVIGEGEETLYEIMQAIQRGSDLKKVKGAVLNGKENYYTPRSLIENLDKIPFLKYKKFDLSVYNSEILPMLFSRGCFSKCAFCSDHDFWKKYRNRSAENVYKELFYHVNVNNRRHFIFHDLVTNGNVYELNKLCDLIIKDCLDVKWRGQMIVHSKMNIELMEKMSKAGCYTITLGIESGSDKVLKLIGKPFSIKQAEKMMRNAKIAGIGIRICIMVGFPGEGRVQFQETLGFLRRNSEFIDEISSINTCLALYNTDLYNRPEKYGIILPPSPDVNYYKWQTEDGNNTYEERVKRAKQALKVCSELGIKVCSTNLFDGEKLDISDL